MRMRMHARTPPALHPQLREAEEAVERIGGELAASEESRRWLSSQVPRTAVPALARMFPHLSTPHRPARMCDCPGAGGGTRLAKAERREFALIGSDRKVRPARRWPTASLGVAALLPAAHRPPPAARPCRRSQH
jgi:hypothetical protein